MTATNNDISTALKIIRKSGINLSIKQAEKIRKILAFDTSEFTEKDLKK